MSARLHVDRTLLWKMMTGDPSRLSGIAHTSLNSALLAFSSSLGDHEPTPRVQSQLLLILLVSRLASHRSGDSELVPQCSLAASAMVDVVLIARIVARSPIYSSDVFDT